MDKSVLKNHASHCSGNPGTKGAANHGRESHARDITTAGGRQGTQDTDLHADTAQVGKATERIGHNQLRARRQFASIGRRQLLIRNKLVGPDLGCHELSDRDQIFVIGANQPGNLKEQYISLSN